jgi:type I restriction enzyme, S subunit
MKDRRKTIGIHDETFDLVHVRDLIKAEVLHPPIDGNHGEIHPKADDFVEEGVPFIMASDLRNGRVDYAGCAKITERQAEGLRKGFARNGDVLLTHKATIGETAIVKYDAHPYVMLTPQVTYYRVRNQDALCNRYLKHYFDSSLLQQTLHMLAGSGSTRAYLGITEQQRLPVIVPPPEKQRKIAAILSAYDDLIANNQRRIVLLEGVAEEIYREWFVRMRFPGAASGAAHESVPVDWELESLEDLGTFLNGYAFDPTEWFDFGFPIIKIKELNSGVSADTPRNPGDKLQERYRFGDGDIIFSWSGSLVVKIWDQGEAWLNQHLFKVTPKNSVSRSFLYLSIKFAIPIFESLTTGATMQHIKRKELRFVKVRVPGPALMKAFDAQVEPMFAAALRLKQASRRLNEIRDVLLPRLISGKLNVDHLDVRLPPSMRAENEAAA